MKLINFITNNAIKLPPLGAVGCVHLVSSRSCARQHESCIAYRQCWILLFGLIQMRPSASTLSYLHCTTALDLITNYLRIHPSQSVGIARSLVRSFVSSVSLGRSSSLVGIVRLVDRCRSFASCRSVSFVRFVGRCRSLGWSLSLVDIVRSVRSWVSREAVGRSVGRRRQLDLTSP
jgi:hypothetical protein